jgi:hypothetical protein
MLNLSVSYESVTAVKFHFLAKRSVTKLKTLQKRERAKKQQYHQNKPLRRPNGTKSVKCSSS